MFLNQLFRNTKVKGDPQYSRRPYVKLKNLPLMTNFTVDGEAFPFVMIFDEPPREIPNVLLNMETEGHWTIRSQVVNDYDARRLGRYKKMANGFDRYIHPKKRRYTFKFEKRDDLAMFVVAGAQGRTHIPYRLSKA